MTDIKLKKFLDLKDRVVYRINIKKAIIYIERKKDTNYNAIAICNLRDKTMALVELKENNNKILHYSKRFFSIIDSY